MSASKILAVCDLCKILGPLRKDAKNQGWFSLNRKGKSPCWLCPKCDKDMKKKEKEMDKELQFRPQKSYPNLMRTMLLTSLLSGK